MTVESEEPSLPPRDIMGIVAGGIVVWGSFLAFGAYYYSPTHKILRGLIVLGCFALFLAAWGLLLRARQRRMRD